MSREIKFRLIKDGKIVGYERYFYCSQREGYVKGKSLVPQYSKDGIHWEDVYIWDLKTNTKGYWFEARIDTDVYIEHDDKEQFTGLLDKNGKEIYEGTITQTITKDGIKLSKFVYFYDEGWARFRKQREDGDKYDCDLISEKGKEVIGNIHENPELLEVKR